VGGIGITLRHYTQNYWLRCTNRFSLSYPTLLYSAET